MDNYYYNNSFEYGFNNYSAAFMLRKKHEISELKMLGKCTGAGVCIYFLFSEIFGLLPYLFGLEIQYNENDVLFYSFTIISSVVCMLAPFLIISKYIEKRLSYHVDTIPVNRPERISDMLLAVPAGFAGCLISNILSTYVDAIIKSTGAELSSPDVNPTGKDPFTLFMCVMCVAVCAPLCEEVVMRGVITQPLKKYGSAFAIGASATVFGLLHCNLVQAPFAIMAGIVLAYLVLITGSIWTSVIIHFLNNFISVLFSYLQNYADNRGLMALDYIITVGGIAVGVICFFILLYRRKNRKIFSGETILSTGEKIKAYFLNVPMILALIFILIITSSYVSV